MYIVVFNIGSSDIQVMTDGHGFIEEFDSYEDANNEASEWLDAEQYFQFDVFQKRSNPD